MSRVRPKIFLWILILILCLAGGVASVLADDGGGSNSLSIQGSSAVPENTQSQYTAYFGGSPVSASWSLVYRDESICHPICFYHLAADSLPPVRQQQPNR